MTKSELVVKISTIYPYMNVRNVERVVDIIIGAMVSSLREGGRVELRGFGSFSVRIRSQFDGRNPRTGAVVTVQEKKVPFFKAGRQLKNLVNGYELVGRR